MAWRQRGYTIANSLFSLSFSLISNFKFIFILDIHFQTLSLSLFAPSFSLTLTIVALQPRVPQSSVTTIDGLFFTLTTTESLFVFPPDLLLSTPCLFWTDLFFNTDFEDRFLDTDFEHRFLDRYFEYSF
ncbi:hypothetical protein CsSME_00035617 [Camellia sinensis var. sinensis]